MRKPSSERKRNEYSIWYNDEPITDLHEVLDLLWVEPRSNRRRYLNLGSSNVDPYKPEIHGDWYTEGDSGGDQSGWYYFQVDPELAKKIQDEGFVEPHEVLYMGGFYLEHHKLVLSERGKEKRQQLYEEKKEAAITLMRPGIYEALPPMYDEHRIFLEREHYIGFGKLSVTFSILNGDEVKIFPDTGEYILESHSN